MITVKDAVKQARQYVSDVFSEVTDLQLEEVDASNGDWNVTLSYLRPVPAEAPPSAREIYSEMLQAALGAKRTYERVYKVVSVDKESGECQSIKIRQFQ